VDRDEMPRVFKALDAEADLLERQGRTIARVASN
jgi:hypothetical protein